MPTTKRHEREYPCNAGESATGSRPLWGLAWNEIGGLRPITTFADFADVCADPGSRLWIDLQNPERELLLRIGRALELHPLVIEDILEQNQRAKIEQTGDALHIVMFALRYEGEVVAHEMDIVLGKRFMLTSHDGRVSPREAPFMRRNPGAHLAEGVDYALWSLTDWLVDDYFPVFDKLGDEIDDLEADVMNKPSSWLVERLFAVRRDLLQIRHAVNPQREIFNQLTNRDLALISPERVIYFRDVYDHLIRLTDELDSYRELVGTALDMYLSQVNNNLSEVMKRLTAVTAVLAGAGAVAGIFGMSEAGLALGFQDMRFWVVTAIIAALSALGFLYFRRIGWI